MSKKNVIIIVAIILVAVLAGIFVIMQKRNNDISYEIAKVESYDFFLLNKDDKVGVIDRSGNIIIDAIYDEIKIPNPSIDIFICYEQNNTTVLNKQKNRLFSEYELVEPIELKNMVSVLKYERNILRYKKDGKYGIINMQGEELTKNNYEFIENLQGTEGKLLVKNNNKQGIINIKGKEILKVQYDEIQTDGYYDSDTNYVNAGFIIGKRTNEGYRYGYVSFDGNIVLKEQFNSITRVSEKDEVYLIAAKDGRYGLYENSNEIIKPEYQSISYTENGALIIERNAKFGIADFEGAILVDTIYTTIEQKGIYLYAENSSEKQVYNENGEKQDINYSKVVYETENEKYRVVTLLNNDVMYYGVESSDGDTLITPSYSYIEYIYSDYFVARDENGNLGVINSQDTKIIDFKYDTLQKIKGKNILQAILPKSTETEIYSSKLENVYTADKAVVVNENGYIAVISDKEIKYFDENGNKIEKITSQNSFPEMIGNYKKVQTSIDNIYYQ